MTMEEAKIFDLFRKQWALVSAGTIEKFNTCTVSWGSMGTIWTRPGKSGSAVTVYIHPSRYTCEFLKECEIFTVSFYPQECRKALGYLGSHSGRDEDKVAASGLTPLAFGDSVTFREAKTTFLCRKVYGAPFDKTGLADDIKEYYASRPEAFPPDEDGDWNPHWIFIGEVIDVKEEE